MEQSLQFIRLMPAFSSKAKQAPLPKIFTWSFVVIARTRIIVAMARTRVTVAIVRARAAATAANTSAAAFVISRINTLHGFQSPSEI